MSLVPPKQRLQQWGYRHRLKRLLLGLRVLDIPQPFYDTGIIFCHTPKAAGISIAVSIYGRPIGHWRALDVRARAPALFETGWSFSVVREPAQRLYSAYEYLYNGGHPEVRWDTYASEYLKDKYPTFEEFCGRGLGDQTVMSYIHFWPQWQFFGDETGQIIVDELYCFEKLESLQRSLSNALGRTATLDVKNRTVTPRRISDVQGTAMRSPLFHTIYGRDAEIFRQCLNKTYGCETTTALEQNSTRS